PAAGTVARAAGASPAHRAGPVVVPAPAGTVPAALRAGIAAVLTLATGSLQLQCRSGCAGRGRQARPAQPDLLNTSAATDHWRVRLVGEAAVCPRPRTPRTRAPRRGAGPSGGSLRDTRQRTRARTRRGQGSARAPLAGCGRSYRRRPRTTPAAPRRP